VKHLPAHAGSKMPLLLLLLLISLPLSFCRGLIIPVLKVHFEIWHLVLLENKREIHLLLEGKVKKLWGLGFSFSQGLPLPDKQRSAGGLPRISCYFEGRGLSTGELKNEKPMQGCERSFLRGGFLLLPSAGGDKVLARVSKLC